MVEMTTRRKRAWWSERGFAVQVLTLGAGLAVWLGTGIAAWRQGLSGGYALTAPFGLLAAMAAQILLTPLVPRREANERRRPWLSPGWSTLAFSLLGAVLAAASSVVLYVGTGASIVYWWEFFWVAWPAFWALLFGLVGFRLGCAFG
jgi:hypothetical protein